MSVDLSTKVKNVNTQKSCAAFNQSCYLSGMVRGDRIDSLLGSLGWSQGDLARRVGVSPQTIWKLVSGQSQGSKHLHRIARELGCSVEYLTGESDDVSGLGKILTPKQPAPSLDDDDIDLTGMVMVREADLVLGLGGSFLQTHVDERLIPFPRDWLRQYTDSDPSMLAFIKLRGDSMTPTIVDGSMGLLDLSRTRLDEQDELWAIAYGEMGMVKRLRQMPDGTVKIMSDNPVVDPETATDGELFIIGRCCGVFKKT